MAFELKQDEEVGHAIRRIVGERISDALEVMRRQRRRPSDNLVHEVRRGLKKARGALRLVRKELGERRFDRENRAFRDAGRPLSDVRDARVLVDTLDGLVAHYDGRVQAERFASLRKALESRRREARQRVLMRDDALVDIARDLKAAAKRLKTWPKKLRGRKTIEAGVRKVYGQSRRAMDHALECGSDEALHEWRKRTKDLRYELELLQPASPEGLAPVIEQAHRLTDLLGLDHDLCVLGEVVRAQVAEPSPPDQVLLLGLIGERRRELQEEAKRLGERLFAEKSEDFAERIEGYWKAWRAAP
jgi:CHAD domain-containing protein